MCLYLINRHLLCLFQNNIKSVLWGYFFFFFLCLILLQGRSGDCSVGSGCSDQEEKTVMDVSPTLWPCLTRHAL